MQQEFTEMIEALFETYDSNKYNIAMGFFEGYASVESDTSGKRFCDLKLHYKDEESVDIPATNVPLMYIGSKSFIVDYELVQGDELLVFFCDRTLEQWKPTSGVVPQDLKDPVKDSLNHAFAIPICTTHNASLITAVPTDSSAIGIRVLPGKKIQLGNGVVELLDLFDQLLSALALPAVQNIGAAATPGALINSATYTALKVLLAQIKV